MIGFEVLLSLLLADASNRVIEDAAVEAFIESRRGPDNGRGRILAAHSGFYDDDAHTDRLVVYTYEHGPNRGDRVYGMYAVAFLTENRKTTEPLFISEADLVSEGRIEYSFDGKDLVLTGKKRLPGDAMCCPSGVASITLSVVDRKVVVLNGEFHKKSASERE